MYNAPATTSTIAPLVAIIDGVSEDPVFFRLAWGQPGDTCVSCDANLAQVMMIETGPVDADVADVASCLSCMSECMMNSEVTMIVDGEEPIEEDDPVARRQVAIDLMNERDDATIVRTVPSQDDLEIDEDSYEYTADTSLADLGDEVRAALRDAGTEDLAWQLVRGRTVVVFGNAYSVDVFKAWAENDNGS